MMSRSIPGLRAYTFRRQMTDTEKQRAVMETQAALSIEKDSGVFVIDGGDGRELLIANRMIVGARVKDALAPREPTRFGFRSDE